MDRDLEEADDKEIADMEEETKEAEPASESKMDQAIELDSDSGVKKPSSEEEEGERTMLEDEPAKKRLDSDSGVKKPSSEEEEEEEGERTMLEDEPAKKRLDSDSGVKKPSSEEEEEEEGERTMLEDEPAKKRLDSDSGVKKPSSEEEEGERTMLEDEPAKKRMKTDDGELKIAVAGTVEDGGNEDEEGESEDKAEEELTNQEEELLLKDETSKSGDEEEPMETSEPTESSEPTNPSDPKETTDSLETTKGQSSELKTSKMEEETTEMDVSPEMEESQNEKDVEEGESEQTKPESNGDDTEALPEEAFVGAVKESDQDKMVDNVVEVNGRIDDDDNSMARSDDSEKENINMDMPMDLSTKSSIPSDDVITLSDSSDDDHAMNGLSNGIVELTPEERVSRRQLVKLLQAELRNEEAKLVLLKKMRQSQVTQQLQDHSNFPPSNKLIPARAHAGHPPPLIRGGQSNGIMGNSKPHGNPMTSSHAMRGQSLLPMREQMQGPPPLVMAPRMSSHMMQSAGLRGGLPPGAAPSNLLAGFRGPLHQQAQAHAQAQQLVQHQQQQQQQADNQTPAQRQAAAKLALRKQLEKTLLQIPPPKPPPPEMNFIPSLISNEFIMLVGLEEVVNYITDTDLIARGEKSADEKLVCTPFTCIQCDTDFTPVWKREKPGSKHVICEMCVTTNQKKALKQEHTNRLKSAFVKALQQEQEIERMQSQSVTTPSTTAAVQVTAAANSTAPSYKQPLPQVVAAAAAEQLRHHQNFIQAHQVHQAHQAHLRATQPLGMPTFNPRGPFHYQIPFKHSDLQRQYLLDMIPSRSMAQGNIGWKS